MKSPDMISLRLLSLSDLKSYHQYKPPAVGMAEPKSAIATPTMKINIEAVNHPHTIPAGPAGMEKARVDAMEGSKPIILNEIPKISIHLKLRRSSCV